MPNPNEPLRYEDPNAQMDYLVHRPSVLEIDETIGASVLSILIASHTLAFEKSPVSTIQRPLPTGTIAEHYRVTRNLPDLDQETRLKNIITAGGVLWLLEVMRQRDEFPTEQFSQPPAEPQFVAFAVTTPSRPKWRHQIRAVKPNCYVKDLNVDPNWERPMSNDQPSERRTNVPEEVLQYAIATKGGYNSKGGMTVDLIEGDPANDGFIALGLKESETGLGPFEIKKERPKELTSIWYRESLSPTRKYADELRRKKEGPLVTTFKIPQARYTLKEGRPSLADIAAQLEAEHRFLARPNA